MVSIRKKLCVSACATAVSCAFGFPAFAQSIDGVQAGLDRAVKLPLEIIWLQSEIQAEMWRNPALAHALQGCTKLGTPKEGCGVSVRSPWRYTFDASSAVRAAPIVISSLNIPNAPFPTGRLNLSGSGRVYLITAAPSAEAIRPPSGAILLAAGSTVQLIDAAYPAIQIEIKAPADQPLFLGNLAESDVTKVVALLVKQPGIVSAGAADISQGGQVALRAVGNSPSHPQSIQVAAISEAPAAGKRAAPDMVISLDQDFTPLAGIVESSVPLPIKQEPLAVASIDLGGLSGKLELPVHEIAKISPETLVLEQDLTFLAGIVESATRLPAPAIQAFAVASVDLSAIAGKLELPVHEIAKISPETLVLEQDLTFLAGIVESATRLPAPPIPAFAVASVDLSAMAGKLEFPVHEVARPAQAETIAAAPQAPAPAIVAAVAVPPVQMAMASPVTAPSSDLAKMRAEIEAEIVRERERMAQSLQGRAAKQFRLGT